MAEKCGFRIPLGEPLSIKSNKYLNARANDLILRRTKVEK